MSNGSRDVNAWRARQRAEGRVPWEVWLTPDERKAMIAHLAQLRAAVPRYEYLPGTISPPVRVN